MTRTLLSIAALCLFAAPAFADDPAPKKPGAAAAPKQDGDKPAAKPEKKKEGDAAKPEKKKEKKEADPNKGPQLRGLIKVMESKVEFTADQKSKIDALVAELQPKYAEASKALAFTPEQQEARKSAQEKAKADGLKGEAATKAVQEAMKLTPEQKSALETQTSVADQFRDSVRDLLTPEQKASLKKKPAA